MCNFSWETVLHFPAYKESRKIFVFYELETPPV